MRKNILTDPLWEKTSIRVGQPSTEGIEAAEEDVKISDYRVWADTAEDGERMCKGKTLTL